MNKRQYKKKYFICKDDNGKMIYAGDTVEVQRSMETRTPHQSVVYWNRLHGAFVDEHPTHTKLKGGKQYHQFLYKYLSRLNPSYDVNDGEGGKTTYFTKCIKVKSFYQD